MSKPGSNREEQDAFAAFRWMCGSGLCFALMSMFVKRLTPQIPQFEMVFFRSAINLTIVLPIVLSRRERLLPPGMALLVFRGLAGFGGVCCIFYAVGRLPLSVSSLLAWSSPIFVMLFSAMFLREKPRPAHLLLAALAFVGVTLLVRAAPAHTALPLIPVIVGLAGGAFGGLAYIAVRAATARFGTYLIVLYFTGVSTALSIPLATRQGWILPNGGAIIELAVMGTCASLAQIMMTRAYRYAAAGVVSTMNLMTAAFSVLLGWWLFDERLAGAQWLGMLILAFAIGCLALGLGVKQPVQPAST